MKLFEKFGLDAQIVNIRGSAINNASLLAGEIQMAVANGTIAVTAAARGAPIVIVATIDPTRYSLISRALTSVQQLKGKTIGIGGFGIADYFVLRRLLPRLGLAPEKDIQFLPTGFTSSFERINVMLAGKFDATLTTRNNIVRAEAQNKRVNLLAGTEEQGSGGDFYTTKDVLKNRPQQVKALFRAFSDAVRAGRDNRELFNRAIRRHMREEHPRLLEAYYENNYFFGARANSLHPPERVLDADMRDLSANVAELRGRRAADFIDAGPLRELEKEGHFTWVKN